VRLTPRGVRGAPFLGGGGASSATWGWKSSLYKHTGPTLAKCAPFKSWFSRDESGKFLSSAMAFEEASSSGMR
jgi:hypothetical protein